ncbi:MAG: putative bifunctional diguanylate cyclase/phosphodiesterase [Shimia sp.]
MKADIDHAFRFKLWHDGRVVRYGGLICVPLLILGAHAVWGDDGLLVMSLGSVMVLVLACVLRRPSPSRDPNVIAAPATGEAGLADQLDRQFAEAPEGCSGALCLAVEIDETQALELRLGRTLFETAMDEFSARLQTAVRGSDTVARLAMSRFAVATFEMPSCDLETAIQVAGRVQRICDAPVTIGGRSVSLSCSVGFCMAQDAPTPTGAALIDAAQAALAEARHAGSEAIRAYSPELKRKRSTRDSLVADLSRALDAGDIRPWFQPQSDTRTGQLTGFEALARWHHAERGMVSPGEFLPALEEAGMMGKLSSAMLSQTLTALKAWDAAGHAVPSVGINFSQDDLANPKLCDRIAWELDRYGLSGNRLAIEVLESVVTTSSSDVISRNLSRLADLGCAIDLDDFGTGNSSIVTLRRFPVSRIKIDRSFVMKADRDEDQRRMLGVILHMAKELDLDTLAEGVETLGELAAMREMGCAQVQGYGIARPMPFDDTLSWLSARTAEGTPGAPMGPFRLIG